jgi:type 1 fimbria pilin
MGSQEEITTHFDTEDHGSVFLKNFNIHVQDCTVSSQKVAIWTVTTVKVSTIALYGPGNTISTNMNVFSSVNHLMNPEDDLPAPL